MPNTPGKILRYGDKARVIAPNRYIRTGYPLTPDIAIRKLVAEHEPEIASFLKTMGFDQYLQKEFIASIENEDGEQQYRLRMSNRSIRKFMAGLGYLYVNANSMGGKSRKVYKEPCEYLVEGQIVTVWDHKHRMTGEYFPPSGGYGSYAEDDWFEPGGLMNQKQNRLVEVTIYSGHTFTVRPKDHEDAEFSGLWMDTADLQKLTDEEIANVT